MVAAAITAVHRKHEQREQHRREQHRHHSSAPHGDAHHQHHVASYESRHSLENEVIAVASRYSQSSAGSCTSSPSRIRDPSIRSSVSGTSAAPVSKPLPYQEEVARLYETPVIQIAVAGLIFGNFIISACQAQVLPTEGSAAETVFLAFEIFFNTAFTIELIMNMYGKFFVPFWKDAWNWFDFGIVTISLMAMVMEDLPGVSVLRLFRAFRVFRLFKRIKSLRLIIEGVMASLPGVSNAFIVLGVIMSIWSIMGVNFFGDDEEYTDFYGNYGKAMLTQFQIMTLDSWASQIGREIILKNSLMSVFFISYIFVTSIMMMNVVVAILLDKFVSTMQLFSAQEELNTCINAGMAGKRSKLERAIDDYILATNFPTEQVCQCGFLLQEYMYDCPQCGTPKEGLDKPEFRIIYEAKRLLHKMIDRDGKVQEKEVEDDAESQALASMGTTEARQDADVERFSMASCASASAGVRSSAPHPVRDWAEESDVLEMLERLGTRTRDFRRRLDKMDAEGSKGGSKRSIDASGASMSTVLTAPSVS